MSNISKLEILQSLLREKGVCEGDTIHKLIEELVDAGNEMRHGLSHYSEADRKWVEFGC